MLRRSFPRRTALLGAPRRLGGGFTRVGGPSLAARPTMFCAPQCKTATMHHHGWAASACRSYATKSDVPTPPSAEKGTSETQSSKTVYTPQLFDRLGLVVPVPSGGWVAREEISPAPTIRMVCLTKPEFDTMPPEDSSAAPVILLITEDLTVQGLDVAEFMEKSKRMAFMQMSEMTQGMHTPTLVHEGPMPAGPFTLGLEYQQVTPDFQVSVMNLFAVENGIAYVMQLVANPETFKSYREQVLEIAKNVELRPSALPTSFADASCLAVETGMHSMVVPPSWKISSNSGPSGVVASFETGSVDKTDSITIFTNDTDSAISDMLAEGCEGKETRKEGDVETTTMMVPMSDGGPPKQRKVLSNGTFTLVAEPLHAPTVTALETFLVEVLQSVSVKEKESNAAAGTSTTTTSSAAAVPLCRYRCPAEQFEFVFPSLNGSVVESRIGDGAVMFAPDGIEAQQNDPDAALLTIRVEDPTSAADCEATIDSWFQRISAVAAKDKLTEVNRETIAGKEAVTFVSREMAETAPGIEGTRCAKIVIFCNGNKTHMLRWEVSGGNFKKSLEQLHPILVSYTFI